MEVLRTAVSALSFYDADEKDNSHDANVRKAYSLTAQIAMIVAIYDRIRKRQGDRSSGPSLLPRRQFPLDAERREAVGDRDPHARYRADPACRPRAERLHLRGPRHRRHPVRHSLRDHRRHRRAEGPAARRRQRGRDAAALTIDKAGADPVEYVKNMLAAKQKISGFGHRVYKTEDPRATHLRRMSEQLGKDAGQPKWYEMSRAIELYINKDKKLNANVDFYSASTYATLGIDIDLYTPIFAVSRIAGWAAHVIEQLDDNRLIRPRAEYIGPEYPSHWGPVEKRP